jgi:4-amino-4-deoxychorismate lyase
LDPDQAPDLIETMHADANGVIARLALHLKRLSESAKTLGYKAVAPDAIRHAVQNALITERGQAQRVRLLYSRLGDVSITCSALPALHGQQKIALSSVILPSKSLWLQHKTTHRPWYLAAMAWIDAHPGFFDLIYGNENGELCEGSRSNLYLKIDGQWCTPVLSSGLLAGVERQALLETGQVIERRLTRSDLSVAQGLRLSNALRGWFDVEFDASLKDEGGKG